MVSRARLFGTDGIRGAFGEAPIDRATLSVLAFELGHLLADSATRPVVVVGGDTRASTSTIYRWLSDGLAAAGATVRWAGVVATPGVAFLVRHLDAACGIAISASHNPFRDNGIKLIGADGFKWSEEEEQALEERFARSEGRQIETASAPPVETGLVDLYLDEVARGLPGKQPLTGLRIALDAANGAAAPYAASFLRRLGAEVHAIHDQPDGTNINAGCGSMHADEVARLTATTGSHIGISFDGDADRLVAADERGDILDGDALLFLWANALLSAGDLEPPSIVATDMSNLALEESLGKRGIRVVRCPVGDRAVVRTMRERGILLGGEQSGHLVHLGMATTGDGLLSASHIALLALKAPLSERVADLTPYPQLIHNVRVRRKDELSSIPGLTQLLESVESRLGRHGRVVLRYSGTEPLARIMIEGPDQQAIEDMARALGETIENHLGLAAPDQRNSPSN